MVVADLFVLTLIALAASIAAALAYWSARNMRIALSLPSLFMLLLPAPFLWLTSTHAFNVALIPVGILGWILFVTLSWRSGLNDVANRWRRLLFTVPSLVVPGLALTASIILWLETTAPRRKAEAELRAERTASIAAVNNCSAALAARDPEADAQRDAGRGDVTPIGLSRFDHWVGLVTFFPGACGDEVMENGGYRPTGKWFPYASSAFRDFVEQTRCGPHIFEYARRYNRRMLAVAPAGAIQRFCQSERNRSRSL